MSAQLLALLNGLVLLLIGVIWRRIEAGHKKTEAQLVEIHSVVNHRLDEALATITRLEAEIRKLTVKES